VISEAGSKFAVHMGSFLDLVVPWIAMIAPLDSIALVNREPRIQSHALRVPIVE
jgi:hypothetical protein